MKENLWAHALGPLNVLIQSEAVIEISESYFDLETFTGSAHLKDLTCVPRGSLEFCLFTSCYVEVCERENLWVPR